MFFKKNNSLYKLYLQAFYDWKVYVSEACTTCSFVSIIFWRGLKQGMKIENKSLVTQEEKSDERVNVRKFSRMLPLFGFQVEEC